MPTLDEVPWVGLDAAFVCTPPGERAAAILAAIEAGVPVLMEKPVGPASAVIAQELARRPIVTAVGYMNRYRRSVRRVRDRIAGNRVVAVTGRWVAQPYDRNWWQSADAGPLNDYATHLVDLFRYLVGEVRDVRALEQGVGSTRSGGACLLFENGACGTIAYSSEGTEKNIALDVAWVGGHASLQGWDLWDGVPDEGDDPFMEETRAFLAAAGGEHGGVLSDFEDARRTQTVVDAIARSASPAQPAAWSGIGPP
jgi:predicted dehydrogenase